MKSAPALVLLGVKHFFEVGEPLRSSLVTNKRRE